MVTKDLVKKLQRVLQEIPADDPLHEKVTKALITLSKMQEQVAKIEAPFTEFANYTARTEDATIQASVETLEDDTDTA